MPQHMDALAYANKVRGERHRIKQAIGAGDLTVAEVLANVTPELSRMALSELLMAQHRWGTFKVRTFCRRLTIHELRPIGQLTERERGRIVNLLTYGEGDVKWAA